MEKLEAICVFCGSRQGADPEIEAGARQLGHLLAEAGIALVYGGGGIGLMGELARAALNAGGKVVGVIPTSLARREVMLDGLTETHVVASMHDRKRMMFELSDAFVSLPGGIGTLDETVEIITWRQLGIHDCPIVLVDIKGYWQPFLGLMRHNMQQGFAYTHDFSLYETVSGVEDVLPALRQARPPGIAPSPELT